MTKNQLLSQDERIAIADRFQDNPLFLALQGVANRFAVKPAGFHIQPEELFYHTLFTIDYLRAQNERQALIYCQNNIWTDLYACFSDHLQPDTSQSDIDLAISTVLESTALFLLKTSSLQMTHIARELKIAIEQHLPGHGNMLDNEVICGMKCIDSSLLKDSVSGYIVGTEVYSTAMDEIIDQIRTEVKESQKPQPTINNFYEKSSYNDIHDNPNSNIYPNGRR